MRQNSWDWLHRHAAVAIGTALLIGVGCGVGIGIAASSSKTRATPFAPSPTAALIPSYLFAISAGSGSLLGPNDQHLTLTLRHTRNDLTRFTDRPLRDAYVIANVDWERMFPAIFGTTAPNAVLAFSLPSYPRPLPIILTIAKPRWNPKTYTWTFAATRIQKQPSSAIPGTTVKVTPLVIPNPTSFGHAELFVDDASSESETLQTPIETKLSSASPPPTSLFRTKSGVSPFTFWKTGSCEYTPLQGPPAIPVYIDWDASGTHLVVEYGTWKCFSFGGPGGSGPYGRTTAVQTQIDTTLSPLSPPPSSIFRTATGASAFSGSGWSRGVCQDTPAHGPPAASAFLHWDKSGTHLAIARGTWSCTSFG